MANEEQFALFDFDDVASPDKSRDAEKAAETSIAEVEADPVDAANNEPSTADARPDVEPDLGSDVTASSDLPPAGIEADGHAIIVTAAGSYTPSGEKLTGPGGFGGKARQADSLGHAHTFGCARAGVGGRNRRVRDVRLDHRPG